LISGERGTVSEMNEGINLVLYPRKDGLCSEKKRWGRSVAEEFSGVRLRAKGTLKEGVKAHKPWIPTENHIDSLG